MVDVTNYDYIRKGRKNKYLHRKKLELIANYSEVIAKLSFFDSICAIEKYYHKKLIPFEAVVTGVSDDVNDSSKIKHIKSEQSLVDKIITIVEGT